MSDEMNNNQENRVTTSGGDGGSHENNQYSFWAEQIASSQSRNQQQGSQDQGNQQQGSEQQGNYQQVSYQGNDQQENFYQGNYQQANYQQENNQQSYQHGYDQQENQQSDSNNGYHPNYTNMNFHQEQSFQQGPKPRRERKANTKARKAVKFVAAAVCAGIIAGGCFTGVLSVYRHFNGDGGDFNLSVGATNSGEIASTTVLDTAVVPDTDVTQVYKNTLPSIIAIDSTISTSVDFFGQTYEQESSGSGSGIIVGETDTELLIATNNHVVDGATKIVVTFVDGTTAEGITKGTDASADLAVVSIDITSLSKDTLSQIKVASLGDSDKVLEGEMAIAIGNALGYGQSITVGYISAVNRTVEFDTGSMELLQTDAAINPGNSGGALINTKGEVIGINSAKLAADTIEGIGYAIPITYAYPILEELMSREIVKEEEQGYLGVSIKEITAEISEAYGMPMGVYIREFTEDSAAEKAGLQERDIITGIDGVEVTTATSLKEKVISYKYGTTVTLTIQRSVDGVYKEMEIEVTLGRNPGTDNSTSGNGNNTEGSENGEQTPDNGTQGQPSFPFDQLPGQR